VSVTADGSGRDDPRPEDPRGIESATVLMRLADGALASLEASWLHPDGYDIRAELLTDAEHLTVGLSARTPARHLDWVAPDERERSPSWSGYLERFEPAYRAELEAFLAAARGEREPATTGWDGVEAMRIAVAATRSYVERRTVELAEVVPSAP
jgi:myo-inositol 2-dehydrogenase / D-chiro-inositol 1-dehydrogenase